jgi:hypothetical protein
VKSPIRPEIVVKVPVSREIGNVRTGTDIGGLFFRMDAQALKMTGLLAQARVREVLGEWCG